MSGLENNPDYWRAKADEARATADSLEDKQARQHMLSCAASYDRLSVLAEQAIARQRKKAANDTA